MASRDGSRACASCTGKHTSREAVSYHSGPVKSSQYTCKLQSNGWSFTCEVTAEMLVVIRMIKKCQQCRLWGCDIRLLASISSPIDPRHDAGFYISACFIPYNRFNKLMETFMEHTIMPFELIRGVHGPRGREIGFTPSLAWAVCCERSQIARTHCANSCDKTKT